MGNADDMRPPGVAEVTAVYTAYRGEKWQAKYVASLEKEVALLRAENARFRKALENVERAVAYATQFDGQREA